MNTILLVFKNFIESSGALVNWLTTPVVITGIVNMEIVPLSILSVTGLIGIMSYLIVRSLIA